MMLSRDVVYMAALFFGAAFSVLLYGRAHRSWPLFFFLASIAVSALALSVFPGGSRISPDWLFYSICAALVLVSCLAFRFPFPCGVPLTVALGGCIVFFSWCFLTPPPLSEGAVLGTIRIISPSNAAVSFSGEAERPIGLSDGGLSAELLELRISPYWPFVGEFSRGALVSISGGDRLVSGALAVSGGLEGAVFPGIVATRKNVRLSLQSQSSGATLSIVHRGGSVSTEPR